MGAWVPQAGHTLLMPSGSEGQHLFVVLNDPVDIPSYPPSVCVLVCICSVPTNSLHYDDACVLNVGSHPFVAHASYVAYKHTRIESSNALIALVSKGIFTPHAPCSDPPFSDIKAGLNSSIFAKRAFKNLPI